MEFRRLLFRSTGLRAARLAVIEEGGDLTFDRIITPAAVENALRVLLAISGSTNAVVHLAAIFGRLGLALDMDLLNRLSDETPVLVDLKPTGAHRSEEHTSELQSLMRITYAVFCCKKKQNTKRRA